MNLIRAPLKATELLKKDHPVLRRLLAEYQRSDRRRKREKRKIYGQLFHELEMHATLEKELLYKAMRKQCLKQVRRACRRHARIDRILKDLARREPGEEGFEEAMSALKVEVERHIANEEQETFPAAEAVLPRRRLEDLAVPVAARRAKLNEGAKE